LAISYNPSNIRAKKNDNNTNISNNMQNPAKEKLLWAGEGRPRQFHIRKQVEVERSKK